MTTKIENLERLARLRDQGILSEEEFAREKALLLAPSATQSHGDAPAHDVSVETRSSEPEDEVVEPGDYLNPFSPIGSPKAAEALTAMAGAAAGLMVFEEVFRFGAHLFQSWEGQVLSPEFSNETSLQLSFANLLFWSVLSIALAWWAIKRRSKTAAVCLVVISLLGVGGVILDFVDGVRPHFGYIALAWVALLSAIQGFRGVSALRRFAGLPSAPVSDPIIGEADSGDRGTSLLRAMETGREASKPLRHAIRWIGLGILVAVAAIVAYWALQPRSTQVETGVGAIQPSAPTGVVPMDPTAALIGTWVGEPEWCASGSAINLDGGGRFSGEGYEGSWLFMDGRLTTSSRSSYDGEGDQVQQANATVQIVSRDEVVLDWGDGATRYRRCVGDVEPWNPAE